MEITDNQTRNGGMVVWVFQINKNLHVFVSLLFIILNYIYNYNIMYDNYGILT